jgi:hypothetical protein
MSIETTTMIGPSPSSAPDARDLDPGYEVCRMIHHNKIARRAGLVYTGDCWGVAEARIVGEERRAARSVLRTLESESELEAMIGGSEVYSHRKSNEIG